jgi:hypothetical protein
VCTKNSFINKETLFAKPNTCAKCLRHEKRIPFPNFGKPANPGWSKLSSMQTRSGPKIACRKMCRKLHGGHIPQKLETSPKRPSPSPPQLWGSNKIRNMDFVETTRSCSKKLEGSLTLHLTPSREHRVTSTRCPRSREACLRSTRWSPRSRFLRSTRGYRQWECLPRSNLKFSLEISPRKPWVLFNPPRTITHRPRPGQRPHPPLLNLLQSTSDTRLRVRSNTASTRKGISPSGGRSDRA